MPLVEVATYQSSLDEKPDAFKALTEALWEAGEYISDNSEDVFEEFAEPLGLQNDDQIDLAAERISPIYPEEFADDLRDSGKEIVRLAAEEGQLEKKPPLDEMFVKPDTL